MGLLGCKDARKLAVLTTKQWAVSGQCAGNSCKDCTIETHQREKGRVAGPVFKMQQKRAVFGLEIRLEYYVGV